MKIIVANWKSHPEMLEQAGELFAAETAAARNYSSVQTIICPPQKFIKDLGANGAQDIFWSVGGDNLGIKYVLVGHSDRRAAGDTDEIINQKLKIALDSGVTPMLLVGEKVKGDDRQVVIEKQLTLGLAGLSAEMIEKVLICYEPVWAISDNSGGMADTPENALAAIRIISNFLAISYQLSAISCLYGGSVNPSNIASFLSHPQISGAVVGQASLDPAQFAEMLSITAKL